MTVPPSTSLHIHKCEENRLLPHFRCVQLNATPLILKNSSFGLFSSVHKVLREYEIKDAHTQKEKEAAIFHKDLFSVNLNAHK